MKQLIIIGAGGLGREILQWLNDLPEYGVEWEVQGFLDDNSAALDSFDTDVKILGGVQDWVPGENTIFVCALGQPDVKRKVCQPLLEAGAEFLTLVHPTALVGDRVRLGHGVVLCPRVTLTCDIEVGDFVMINCHSTMGHDAVIGDWATVSAHCDLTGGTEVGEGAFLGSRATIIPNKSVGAHATVGAGSVVIRSVPDGIKVFGNPAREFS